MFLLLGMELAKDLKGNLQSAAAQLFSDCDYITLFLDQGLLSVWLQISDKYVSGLFRITLNVPNLCKLPILIPCMSLTALVEADINAPF